MTETTVSATPAIDALESISKVCDTFECTVMIRDKDKEEYNLKIVTSAWYVSVFAIPKNAAYPDLSAPKDLPNEERPFIKRLYRGARPGKSWFSPGEREYTFAESMIAIATGLPDAKLLIDSIKVKAKGSTVKGPELKEAAIAAWCEAKGIEVPSAKELKTAKQDSKNFIAEQRKNVVEQWRSGETGIDDWNSLPSQSKSDFDLKDLDLSGADLTNLNLSELNVSGTNFSGTNLTGAKLSFTEAKGCNFNDTIFRDAELDHFIATDSTFDGAAFENTRGYSAYFIRAKLTNAKFANADLESAQFDGADLTGATFTDCKLKETAFDIHTILPDNFEYLDDLQFNGKGLDPRKLKAFNEAHAGEGINFETFLDRIGEALDKERLKKSLSMLKKERFELFSEVKDDSVLGIVKSQTDPDLFYSCRLTSDGQYYCCTQNLKPCGGLRGAICKHILVLIIGLAKAVQLDPVKADQWAQASTKQQPKLDKDIASQAFLRYKGAEAGEVDWRPTETTPEDFYAF